MGKGDRKERKQQVVLLPPFVAFSVRADTCLRKLFTPPDEVEWHRDELMAVLFVARALIALAAGLAAGMLPLTGIEVVLEFALLFMPVSTFLVYRLMRIDTDEFGGQVVLQTDGVGVSMGVFNLTWILAYSYFQAGP